MVSAYGDCFSDKVVLTIYLPDNVKEYEHERRNEIYNT